MAGGTLEDHQEIALKQLVNLQSVGQFKVGADSLTGAGMLVLGNDAIPIRTLLQ